MANLCPECGGSVFDVVTILDASTVACALGESSTMPEGARARLDCLSSQCDFSVFGHLEGATIAPDGSTYVGGHFVAGYQNGEVDE